jgi:hypothetical protein
MNEEMSGCRVRGRYFLEGGRVQDFCGCRMRLRKPMGLKERLFGMVVLGSLLAGAVPGLAQEKPVEVAQKAETSWLELVDAGKYAESWKAAAAAFQAAVTEEKWGSALSSVRTPLGKLVTRTMQSATYTKTLPRVPDGDYVVVLYQTSFEKKQMAQETVIASKEKDGVWRVAGYYIK